VLHTDFAMISMLKDGCADPTDFDCLDFTVAWP